MTTVYDVPPDRLLKHASTQLASDAKLAAPEWSAWVKTGVHREKAPTSRDWWSLRVASLLRHVYINGPIGVIHLSSHYGGTHDRGGKPNRARQGSRSIVRAALKQLEAAGYVQAIKGRGRVVTAKGRSLLDNAAHHVAQELEAQIPELKKY